MDTELVVRAQHGDEEAFASLAVAVGDRLHAVSHRILRDIDLAEDATQQAPGRTGSSCVPVTPRAVAPASGRRTSDSCRLTSRWGRMP